MKVELKVDSLLTSVLFLASSSQLKTENSLVVAEADLEHICRLVEVKDGGPAWIQMMDRSTPTMSYKAWRRDPDVGFLYPSVNIKCLIELGSI